jgi:hypothetical protein
MLMKPSCLFALLLSFLLFTPLAQAGEENETYHLISVKVDTQLDFLKLQSLGLDLLKFNPETLRIEVVAPASKLNALLEAGLRFEKKIHDMSAYYEKRL